MTISKDVMKLQWDTTRGMWGVFIGWCAVSALVLIILSPSPASADIYKKRLPDGTLCFTNMPTGGDWDIYFRERKGNNYRFPGAPVPQRYSGAPTTTISSARLHRIRG
jgi:hypothetical protein